MTIMSVKFTVRIPKELRAKMKKLSHVNWSEVVRRAIEEKVHEEEINWALKVMDKLAAKAKPERPMSKVIREFRDSRR